MITVKLKRGAGIPTIAQLDNYEMGWSVDNKKLYINDNGTITPIGREVEIALNGAAATPEGSFTIYSPASITQSNAGQMLKVKSTVTAGQDPFEFIAIDAAPVSISSNLVTSGGVYSALDTKVDKNGTDRLITQTELTKLSGIEVGAEVNIIEQIQVDGVPLVVTSRTVNITGKENVSNKATTLALPDDTKYPTTLLLSDELLKKVDNDIVNGSSRTQVNNTGDVFEIIHEVTAGSAIQLRMVSGEVFLAKYTTGNSPTFSDSNRLLNRAEVAAMITGDASRLITSRSGTPGNYVYEAFTDAASLLAGPYYYQESVISSGDLTVNDFAYVKDDENYNNKQTMYVYDGASWTFAVQFSEDPLNADNATLEVYNTNFIRVKDLGISSAKLADGAVVTDKIGDNQVTLQKLVGVPGAGAGRFIGYDVSDNPYIIDINNNVAAPTEIYAPISSGVTGQVLYANTDAAPTWGALPAIPTITLNGSQTMGPNFYAPVTGGNSGEIMISQGTGNAPIWTDTIDGGTW